jgi:hypothetical protein
MRTRRCSRCERREPENGIRFASSGSSQAGCEKELAPGGHQEQGESRVTEFRAPDLEIHRVPKWQNESQQPLSAKSISGRA